MAADYSYLGSGKIYLREIGGSAGLIEAGNCSALNFSVNEDVKELKDFTQAGGGTQNEVRRISSVECSITFHDINATNLARALYGTASSVTSAAVVGESVTVYPNALAPFANVPLSTVTPTVTTPTTTARANTTPYTLGQYLIPAAANGYYYKVTTAGTSGGTVPTYPTTVGATVTDGTAVYTVAGKTTPVAGTDYELRGGGLFVFNTLAGEVWTVGYTKAATDVINALTTPGKEYELFFDGLNEARSGKTTTVNAYRVRLGAAQDFALIGDDYAGLELTGKVLKDTTKTGAGISQYFAAKIVT